MLFNRHKSTMATAETALPGRDRPILSSPAPHTVLGTPIVPPYPDGFEVLDVGLGCFWGAERMFWKVPGVYTTAVGYAGGFTRNPTYAEVCSGLTGHAEAVRVVYDPAKVSAMELLKVFWEGHDPTQGMAQGNDVGTQYRSAIFYTTEAQKAAAEQTRETFGKVLGEAGFGDITTEIVPAGPFYFAEDEHQQYLDKVPWGYCPDHGTGASCPIGLGVNQQG